MNQSDKVSSLVIMALFVSRRWLEPNVAGSFFEFIIFITMVQVMVLQARVAKLENQTTSS